MAKKHMEDISSLLPPLRKQRAEWLKETECPRCGKPAHKQAFSNGDVHYSHFQKGVYVGSCKVCPTKDAADSWYAPVKEAESQPEVLPVSVVGTHQLPLI